MSERKLDGFDGWLFFIAMAAILTVLVFTTTKIAAIESRLAAVEARK